MSWAEIRERLPKAFVDFVEALPPGSRYAGIGSRQTPPHMLAFIEELAAALAGRGLTARSGGADGADTAFEAGSRAGGVEPEIFLPWNNFNGRKGVARVPQSAVETVDRFHPAPQQLSRGARSLMARNAQQVLGAGLDEPSSFVLAWTVDGTSTVTTAKTGGTGQAIRIAVSRQIPVFNLNSDEAREAYR